MRGKQETAERKYKPIYASNQLHSRLKLLAAFEKCDLRDALEAVAPDVEKRIAAHMSNGRKAAR